MPFAGAPGPEQPTRSGIAELIEDEARGLTSGVDQRLGYHERLEIVTIAIGDVDLFRAETRDGGKQRKRSSATVAAMRKSSGSGWFGGVGVGLGITRLRAMKLMKLPSGDHATVSGNTHEIRAELSFE